MAERLPLHLSVAALMEGVAARSCEAYKATQGPVASVINVVAGSGLFFSVAGGPLRRFRELALSFAGCLVGI